MQLSSVRVLRSWTRLCGRQVAACKLTFGFAVTFATLISWNSFSRTNHASIVFCFDNNADQVSEHNVCRSFEPTVHGFYFPIFWQHQLLSIAVFCRAFHVRGYKQEPGCVVSPPCPSPSFLSHPLPRSIFPLRSIPNNFPYLLYKLPHRGLGRIPLRNWIWGILALKSDIWWEQNLIIFLESNQQILCGISVRRGACKGTSRRVSWTLRGW